METRQTWSEQVTIRVRQAIKDAGLTEEYVGDQIGRPNATFSRLMNVRHSKYTLTIDDLEQIADLLGVSPAEFVPAPGDLKARAAS
ncbi:helix-turn-helix domain-containing protein [Nocardia sp. N2S4-5]|uniref:helix-turn-helix domain-containing protein n=1 Tax=Nocardia sp. N2S4-5 TaxID=3351565 RepID=UPI0037D23F07